MQGERYVFTGKLICETGLHIGSGRGSIDTEATVVIDHNGRPLIPGSSLKGAMRSTVEHLGQALQHTGKFTSCLLFEKNDALQCLTCNESLRATYEQMCEQPGIAEQDLWNYLNSKLCDTCKVFGSPHFASKTRISDSCWIEGGPTVVRHGVGIDRDTETARQGIKFDFQVVQPETKFTFEMIVENPEGRDLQLVSLALKEMENEGIRLGGIKSRGLGKVRLELDSTCTLVNLADPTQLLEYLLQDKTQKPSTAELLSTQLRLLL